MVTAALFLAEDSSVLACRWPGGWFCWLCVDWPSHVPHCTVSLVFCIGICSDSNIFYKLHIPHVVQQFNSPVNIEEHSGGSLMPRPQPQEGGSGDTQARIFVVGGGGGVQNQNRFFTNPLYTLV